MEEKNSINNVIIFDGTKEYKKQEILENSDLNRLASTITNFGGFSSLIERINQEDGLLYINADPDHKRGSGDLKNVSKELYTEYLKRRP